MLIQARYAGKCNRCGQRFQAGTMVNWTKRPGASGISEHEACPQQAAPAPAIPVTIDLNFVAWLGTTILEQGGVEGARRYYGECHEWWDGEQEITESAMRHFDAHLPLAIRQNELIHGSGQNVSVSALRRAQRR